MLIGVDVGTGSARAGVFDDTGRLLGVGKHPVTMWQEPGEIVEQSSDQIWSAVCRAVRGALAAAAIASLRPDIFFLGVTAIHPRHGFSTGDAEEAAIKRQIAAQARETWVTATLDKLDAASPVTIMPLEAATGVIVPRHIGRAQSEMLAEAGLTVVPA